MSIYDELGVKRYINAQATLTIYGGSIMPPEVIEAMRDAANSFVSIRELQKKAGNCIAKLTHNEAAYISNGAAAGMLLATAACIAGDDEEKKNKLPHTDGMANEIVIYGPVRISYDFAIRQAGGVLITYGNPVCTRASELEAVLSEKTAAIFVFYKDLLMKGQLALDEIISIAHSRGIPVIVDAAAQLPMRENLWRFTRDFGADLAIFSGGKGLRGPQSSGLIVGKRGLIDRIASLGCPHIGIGRPLKVGKEEIAGLLAAVRLYMQMDEAGVLQAYERQVQMVLDAFDGYPAVQVSRDFPSEAGQPMPRARVRILGNAPEVCAQMIADALREGEPGVLVETEGDCLLINPQTLMPGEIEIVVARLKDAIASITDKH